MSLVTDYLNGPLAKFLNRYGVSKEQQSSVLRDVRHRLDGLLRHWGDVNFRRTLTVLSTEEALFWRPQHISVEIRSLVLLAIRNSYIEELHFTPDQRRSILPDKAIPELTSEAVRFFAQIDWTPQPAGDTQDIFSSLPERFPSAWAVLTEVAKLDGSLEREFEWTGQPSKSLDSLLGVEAKAEVQAATVVFSGIAPEVDPQLRDFLASIQRGEVPLFFVPSFFRATRNPSKLLAMIDLVLASGATFLTLNYMLSPGKVARRQSLRRPPHDYDEVRAAMLDFEGLAPSHETLLRALS